MKLAILAIFLLVFIIPPIYAKTIVVLGDSLSAGYGIDEKKGWVNLLNNKLQKSHYPYRLVNISASGDTTSNGLAKLPQALQAYHPAFVLLQLGANDGLRGLSLAQMKSNLAKLIEMSQKANAKVLLIATLLPPNYGPVYLEKFKQVYSDLAKQYNIPLIPMFLEGVAGNPAFMQKDGLHPNQQAQSKIMANVWIALVPMLDKE